MRFLPLAVLMACTLSGCNSASDDHRMIVADQAGRIREGNYLYDGETDQCFFALEYVQPVIFTSVPCTDKVRKRATDVRGDSVLAIRR